MISSGNRHVYSIFNATLVPFGSREGIRLCIRSEEWQRWISGRLDFIIRAEDVGKEFDAVNERRKNFNRNLLHEFLDQFSPVVMIGENCYESITDTDNYPHYFWDNSIAVSGSSSGSNKISILARVRGLETCPAIEISGKLYFKYWQFLPNEKKPFMNVVLKWHKALISLYHLIGRDNIDIPINFEKLERDCVNEIRTASVVKSI